MKNFYTPDTFNSDLYKKTCWKVSLIKTEFDNGKLRLIVSVATGRKYWPLFTVLPNFELGIKDPVLVEIKESIKRYTFPLVKRFVDELEIMLSDVYQEKIILSDIQISEFEKGTYSNIQI